MLDIELNIFPIMRQKKALVFSGGGARGIAHVGALSRIFERFGKLDYTHVIGTSAGAIISTVLACRGTIKYMKETLLALDLTTFKDNSNCQVRNIYSFWKKYGWYDGNALENWMGDVLQQLTGNRNITFKELHNISDIHLTIVYLTIIGKNKGKTFYADHLTTPDMSIKQAVRRSTSIPFYYKPDPDSIEDSYKKHLNVDGGVTNNYPINVPMDQGIDPEHVLGFRFCANDRKDNNYNCYIDYNEEEIDPINNPIDYALTLIDILWEQASRVHVHKEDWERTVKIYTGDITSTHFDLTVEQKEYLFNQGVKAVDEYVDNYEV